MRKEGCHARGVGGGRWEEAGAAGGEGCEKGVGDKDAEAEAEAEAAAAQEQCASLESSPSHLFKLTPQPLAKGLASE